MLGEPELAEFRRAGFVHCSPGMGPATAEILVNELNAAADGADGDAREADGITLRASHGGHLRRPLFERFARAEPLVRAAELLLGTEVYVYQFKINLKKAFDGEKWPWHDDYVFWREEDGLPHPNILTAAVFLDDVTEFNGPMYFIPQSHRASRQDVGPAPLPSTSWLKNVSEDLKYQSDRRLVVRLASKFGLASCKGPRGTVAFFDSQILHASSSNISPGDRRILLITYCSVDNLPTKLERPEFLVSRDHRALTATPWPIMPNPMRSQGDGQKPA